MRLDKKVAIITGASSGIGAAAAELFAKQGAKVILGARREHKLKAIVDRIQETGGDAVAIAGDVKNETYAQDLVNAAMSNYGKLDIAFNNAGIMGTLGAVTSLPDADWQAILQTNLTSGFYAAKYQLPAMLETGSGSLIFTSSFVGHTIGLPGMAAYAASKAGLVGMTQCLAAEYGPHGIRVNALLPGGTHTEMAPDPETDPESVKGIAGLHALKRMADATEIAEAAMFLASEASSFVTGTAMLVDGGNSINKM